MSILLTTAKFPIRNPSCEISRYSQDQKITIRLILTSSAPIQYPGPWNVNTSAPSFVLRRHGCDEGGRPERQEHCVLPLQRFAELGVVV